VDKYLNQGSSEQKNLLISTRQNENAIIGKFGLGFYSAFMVRIKWRGFTNPITSPASGKWECDGSPGISLEEYNKTERGTDVVLHIMEDSAEFPMPQDTRYSGKFCRFPPIPVFLEENRSTIRILPGVNPVN
jgi:molecular chaperone HtpG